MLGAIIDFSEATAIDPGVVLGRLVNLEEEPDKLRWLTFTDLHNFTNPVPEGVSIVHEPVWSNRTLKDSTLAITRFQCHLPPQFMRATGEFDYKGDWLRKVRAFEVIQSRHIPDRVLDREFPVSMAIAPQVNRSTLVFRDRQQQINVLF